MKLRLENSDLEALTAIAQSKEWKVLQRILENRKEIDKNAIVRFPEADPVQLAINKAFLRGRISAVHLVIKEINSAPDLLEKMETKTSSTQKG